VTRSGLSGERSAECGAVGVRPRVHAGLLGAGLHRTKYTRCIAGIREYLVSSSGQLSLPAAARHRWKLDEGGPVDVIDLGFAVMMLPRGEGRRLLNDLLPRDRHAEFAASLSEDPDLATT
jgi:bifunctional DNA-binding transcriptional regulator/antitoxin component of YhaV-PrlF toxin-antitoxin module